LPSSDLGVDRKHVACLAAARLKLDLGTLAGYRRPPQVFSRKGVAAAVDRGDEAETLSLIVVQHFPAHLSPP
jgi:hypothetical protein